MSTRDGVRVTTADAYLPREAAVDNLAIRADAQVADIVFDGATRACGVRLSDGSTVEAGWVVLCAGTYGTPPILMRSGVGPADELRKHGIPVVVDLSGVGRNLADHPGVYVDFGYSGPARSTPILHTIATFHSAGRSTEDTPDLMFWFGDPTEQDPTFGIEVVLLRPLSRGRVRLRSKDPLDPPIIELPSLSEGHDVVRLAEGCRRAIAVANDPGVRELCDGAAPVEPRDMEAWIRAEAYSIPHVVGTCAMGARPQEGAVVDATGRVRGTERLSVVDASIMPDVPSGFVQFPVIMVAERLSEVVASQM